MTKSLPESGLLNHANEGFLVRKLPTTQRKLILLAPQFHFNKHAKSITIKKNEF